MDKSWETMKHTFTWLTMANACKELNRLLLTIYYVNYNVNYIKVTKIIGTPKESSKFLILLNNKSYNFLSSYFSHMDLD